VPAREEKSGPVAEETEQEPRQPPLPDDPGVDPEEERKEQRSGRFRLF
jgi:uncharacterized membrane-anchored protein